jgi:hypothetical protein
MANKVVLTHSLHYSLEFKDILYWQSALYLGNVILFILLILIASFPLHMGQWILFYMHQSKNKCYQFSQNCTLHEECVHNSNMDLFNSVTFILNIF